MERPQDERETALVPAPSSRGDGSARGGVLAASKSKLSSSNSKGVCSVGFGFVIILVFDGLFASLEPVLLWLGL